jgi:hypothetical protein
VINGQRQDRALRGVLTRAVHCAYLARPDGADMVAAILDSVLENGHSRVVAVEFGRKSPELTPLLSAIGAQVTAHDKHERQWLDAPIKGGMSQRDARRSSPWIAALLAAGIVIAGMLLFLLRSYR